MKCASIRGTIWVPRSPLGTRAGGMAPWRAAMRSHTRVRTAARVVSIRSRVCLVDLGQSPRQGGR